MVTIKFNVLSVALFLIACNCQAAIDKVTTPNNQVIKLKATIVGTKEQPRFLSIVPWKKLTSPLISASKNSNVIYNQLIATSPQKLEKKRQLTQYLKGRYVKKLATNK